MSAFVGEAYILTGQLRPQTGHSLERWEEVSSRGKESGGRGRGASKHAPTGEASLMEKTILSHRPFSALAQICQWLSKLILAY